MGYGKANEEVGEREKQGKGGERKETTDERSTNADLSKQIPPAPRQSVVVALLLLSPGPARQCQAALSTTHLTCPFWQFWYGYIESYYNSSVTVT